MDTRRSPSWEVPDTIAPSAFSASKISIRSATGLLFAIHASIPPEDGPARRPPETTHLPVRYISLKFFVFWTVWLASRYWFDAKNLWLHRCIPSLRSFRPSSPRTSKPARNSSSALVLGSVRSLWSWITVREMKPPAFGQSDIVGSIARIVPVDRRVAP